MKTIFYFLPAFFLFLKQKSSAQQYYNNIEFGGSLGVSSYFGDINPNYGLQYFRPTGSILVKKNFNPYISLHTSATYTRIGYSDHLTNNEFQNRRNLSFRSDIYELALMSEFNFFFFETGDMEHRFTPFLSLGVAGFHYSPKGFYADKWYDLRGLGTEGQNYPQYADRKYGRLGLAIPVGAGLKWWLTPGINMSFQVLNRFTAHDYLDDVSNTYVDPSLLSPNPNFPTLAGIFHDRSSIVEGKKLGTEGKKRGDTSTKDQYITAHFTITFQLKTYKCPRVENMMWQSSNVTY